MLIKTLIATGDCDYSEHLSNALSGNHSDAIDVCVCSTADNLRELLAVRKFDVALLEAPLIGDNDLHGIRLPLLLLSDDGNAMLHDFEDAGDPSGQTGSSQFERAANRLAGVSGELKSIRKYQRISSIAGSVLEQYSKVLTDEYDPESKKASITVVWSPAGGVGKTTVALAYAANRVSDGKQVLYLNLENFSSSPVYFAETGKSISAVFEMIESQEGNIKLLIRGIRQFSSDAGVSYLGRPGNFDDMNILSSEDVVALITACSDSADELIIDMSSACDERTRQAFELADRILLVTDPSSTAQTKYSQFVSQHNVFENIRMKSVLVANRGASVGDSLVGAVVRLPIVQSTDPTVVYKALSCNSF